MTDQHVRHETMEEYFLRTQVSNLQKHYTMLTETMLNLSNEIVEMKKQLIRHQKDIIMLQAENENLREELKEK